MGNWSIIIPEATTNYVNNPSFETGTTGWVDSSSGTAAGTRTRVTTWQQYGIYSYEIEKTSGTGIFTSQHYPSSSVYADFAIGGYAILSADVLYDSGGVSLILYIDDGTFASRTITITTSGRHSIAYGPITGAVTNLIVELRTGVDGNDANPAKATFDAIQLEYKGASYATTYCDGTLEGCKWLGEQHASKSSRDVNKALGGREYNLDDLSYHVLQASSIGMPSLDLITEDRPLLDGTLLRNYSVNQRDITLLLMPEPTSLANLHSLRKALIDLIRPDRYGRNYRPFTLRYYGADTDNPLDIEVVYDAGLEYQPPGEGGWHEPVTLRLLAPSPVWRENGNRAASLTSQRSLEGYNFITECVDGDWLAMGTGLYRKSGNPGVTKIKRGPDNRIYVSGYFDNAGGVANTKNFAVWNPESRAWSSLNSGTDTGTDGYVVTDFLWDAAGNLYLCGSFTQFASVTNSGGIVKWVAATETWTSVLTGSSFSGVIYSMCLNPNGVIYMVGNYSQLGGATAYGFSYLSTASGGTVTNYGSAAYSAAGYGAKIVSDSAGIMYVGGSFTAFLSSSRKNISKLFLSGGSFGTAAVGYGLNSSVANLLLARDGTLYITGVFTAESTSGLALIRCASWNGSQYKALGDGLRYLSAMSMCENENGEIIFSGDNHGFTVVEPVNQVWNGHSFSFMEPEGIDDRGGFLYMDDNKNGYFGFGTGYDTAGATYSESNYDSAVLLRDTGGNKDKLAQSFITPSTDFPVTRAKLYMRSFGTVAGTLTLRIETNNAGSPSGTLADANATTTIEESYLSTSYAHFTFVYPVIFTLTASTTYWLVLSTDRAAHASNYISWGADGSAPYYASGEMKSEVASSWGAESKDACFTVYYVAAAYNDAKYTATEITTMTNESTKSIEPIFTIKRGGGTSARLLKLHNLTTDDIIWLDYSLSDGETLTLDLTSGKRHATSDRFGNVWNAVLPSADLSTFKLLPGDNDIAVYVKQVGSPTVTIYVQTPLEHWSADGAAP